MYYYGINTPHGTAGHFVTHLLLLFVVLLTVTRLLFVCFLQKNKIKYPRVTATHALIYKYYKYIYVPRTNARNAPRRRRRHNHACARLH